MEKYIFVIRILQKEHKRSSWKKTNDALWWYVYYTNNNISDATDFSERNIWYSAIPSQTERRMKF